jgi:hypothetical protein
MFEGCGVAGASGWWGSCDGELVEDLGGGFGIVDEGEDAETAGALWAFEDVDVEGAGHERRPVHTR